METDDTSHEDNQSLEQIVEPSETVERVPWKEYLRSQFQKIGGFLLMLIILLVVIDLSATIAPDRLGNVNPDGVIDVNSRRNQMIMGLSFVLFVLVLVGFSKAVLIDHKEEFGITNWTSIRALVTTLLTSSFIALVFILLDVALINVYLTITPVWSIWRINFLLGGGSQLLSWIPATTDRLAYSDIRGIIFSALLLLVFLFPVVMFIVILTRFGRKTIKERREKEKKYYWKRVFTFLFGIPLLELLLLLIQDYLLSVGLEVFSGIILVIMIIGGIIWGGAVLFFFINLIRLLAVFTFTNFLLIFPFVFLFYLVPGVIWATWDIFLIIGFGTVENTIYTEGTIFAITVDPVSLVGQDYSFSGLLHLYFQTVWYNLGNAIRIVELDFVIIIGLGALIIGFAEGYSIFAILRSITTGVSIAKTGRVATRSPPRIIVISSRLIYLFAWMSVLWDKLLVILTNLANLLAVNLPLIDLPSVFTILYAIERQLPSFGDFFLFLSILIVPFYFIITSSFKFLSVGLVLEKTQEDVATYILLISSAFILIVTNILADISALEPFLTIHRAYLPLQGLTTEDFIPFVANVFDILESIAFYTGVGFTFLTAFRSLIERHQNS